MIERIHPHKAVLLDRAVVLAEEGEHPRLVGLHDEETRQMEDVAEQKQKSQHDGQCNPARGLCGYGRVVQSGDNHFPDVVGIDYRLGHTVERRQPDDNEDENNQHKKVEKQMQETVVFCAGDFDEFLSFHCGDF